MSVWFTVIYLLGAYEVSKSITVDGEEIMLRIVDTAAVEQFCTTESILYYPLTSVRKLGLWTLHQRHNYLV